MPTDDSILLDVEPVGVVYVGAVAPEALRVTATNQPGAVSPLDLSSVHAPCLMRITDPKGNKRTWACAITAQSAGASPPMTSSISLAHTYAASGGDIDLVGRWRCTVVMPCPGGFRRLMAFEFESLPE